MPVERAGRRAAARARRRRRSALRTPTPCAVTRRAQTRAQRRVRPDDRDLHRRGERPLVGAEQHPERRRVLRHRRAEHREHAGGCRRRGASSPVTAARRSSASAASEFSLGVALSKKSCGRTMSASASEPVVKKPPLAASENRSRQLVGEHDRVLEPGDVVVLGRGDERPDAARRSPRPRRGGGRRRRPATTAAAGRRRAAARSSEEAQVGPGRVHPVGAVERRRGLERATAEQRVPRRAAPCRRGRAGPASRVRVEQPAERAPDRVGTRSRAGRPGAGCCPSSCVCGSTKLPPAVDAEAADAPRRASSPHTSSISSRLPEVELALDALASRRPRRRRSRRRRGAGRAARTRSSPRRPAR